MSLFAQQWRASKVARQNETMAVCFITWCVWCRWLVCDTSDSWRQLAWNIPTWILGRAVICFVGWAVASCRVVSADQCCLHWFMYLWQHRRRSYYSSRRSAVSAAGACLPHRALARHGDRQRCAAGRHGATWTAWCEYRRPPYFGLATPVGKQVLLSGGRIPGHCTLSLSIYWLVSASPDRQVVIVECLTSSSAAAAAMSSFQWQKLSPTEFLQLHEYTSCKCCFLIAYLVSL